MSTINIAMDIYSSETMPVVGMGLEYSSRNEIKVNKALDGTYRILYYEYEFYSIDPSLLATNIINLFMRNLSNCNIEFTVNHHRSAKKVTEDDVNIMMRIIEFSNIMSKINPKNDNNNIEFTYIISNSLRAIAAYLSAALKDDNNHISKDPDYDFYQTSDDEDEDDEDDDEDNDEDDVVSMLAKALYGTEFGDSKNGRKKKSKKEYASSKVMKAAKNPKRSYYRHGVMICPNKDAIKKDEKIIKEFLKDFIPGNSNWKKDFRDDLIKRWMRMYVVTSKQLKHLEKQHRKTYVSKRRKSSIDTDKALEFTRRLFNTPVDKWNDPSR